MKLTTLMLCALTITVLSSCTAILDLAVPATGHDWWTEKKAARSARQQAIHNGWDDGHNPETIMRCSEPATPITPETTLVMRDCWQRDGQKVLVIQPGPAILAPAGAVRQQTGVSRQTRMLSRGLAPARIRTEEQS